MATLIVTGFPPGATVTAYEAGISVPIPPAGNAPFGTPVDAVVATDGTAVFSALPDGTSFILYCPPAQYVRATTPPVTAPGGGGGGGGGGGTGNARVLVWLAGSSAYDHPEWWTDTSEPREFRGPVDPNTITGIVFAFADVFRPTSPPP